MAGESLSRVAAICGLSEDDILEANPELCPYEQLQPGDCIALPLPNVLPRLYAAQPGDTLRSIAKVGGTAGVWGAMGGGQRQTAEGPARGEASWCRARA